MDDAAVSVEEFLREEDNMYRLGWTNFKAMRST